MIEELWANAGGLVIVENGVDYLSNPVSFQHDRAVAMCEWRQAAYCPYGQLLKEVERGKSD